MTKPNVARMYDYWLGGKDNFEVDRKAAEAVRQLRPNVAEQALDKETGSRPCAVSYVAARGVRQFLDIGSGLPTSPGTGDGCRAARLATHEAARAVIPDAMVAYVDHDSVAVLHSQACSAGAAARSSRSAWTCVTRRQSSLTMTSARPGSIRARPRAWCWPACWTSLDAEIAQGIAGTFVQALAPGSYVAISVGFGRGRAGPRFRQHVQRPARSPDLCPCLGGDHRDVRRGAGAARHGSRPPIACWRCWSPPVWRISSMAR